MSPEFSTLVQILRWRAARQPDRKAYTFLIDGDERTASLTYAELDRRARTVAAWLQSSGAPGKRVLLLLPPGLENIAAFFGCLYSGAVAVPTSPPRPNGRIHRLKAVASDARADFAVTTSTLFARLESTISRERELGALRWLAVDRLDPALCADWREPEIHSDGIAFLQYTSGSTSEPKGVIVTHGNLLCNSAIIHRSFGHNPLSRGVIWLPPYHDMGLIGGIVQPLYGGFEVTLMSPTAFLMRPVRWLRAISRTRATTSGGPNFAYELCARRISPEQRVGLDLSSWQVAFSGAEPVRRETMERFTAAFAAAGFRPEAFYPCYGLAEATLFVAGGPRTSRPVTCKVDAQGLERHHVRLSNGNGHRRELVSCGKPAPEFEVAIVDPERLTRCPENRVGEIWLSGRSVARGYWNRAEDTEKTFRACLADTGEGPFLRTGDLGFLLDGGLVLAGRLKEMMIFAGRNHYPHDIEQTTLEACRALQPGNCAAFSVDLAGEEKLVLFIELDDRKRNRLGIDRDELLASIRRAVSEHHDLSVHDIVLLAPGGIPKTTSGKIQRHICRSRFMAMSMSSHDPEPSDERDYR
ncbi:MAG TPA: fatty acyl-AMP ligase [Candidatus Eisenbacteria bacterium]|nr:fatty acyl-AMP ligase [Candidatus Eisenbacteria bacterium]